MIRSAAAPATVDGRKTHRNAQKDGGRADGRKTRRRTENAHRRTESSESTHIYKSSGAISSPPRWTAAERRKNFYIYTTPRRHSPLEFTPPNRSRRGVLFVGHKKNTKNTKQKKIKENFYFFIDKTRKMRYNNGVNKTARAKVTTPARTAPQPPKTKRRQRHKIVYHFLPRLSTPKHKKYFFKRCKK